MKCRIPGSTSCCPGCAERTQPAAARRRRVCSAGLAACLLALALGGARGGTLDEVRKRGHLLCGLQDASPPFSVMSASGERIGFDVDHCKTVAAAIFGKPRVEFVLITPHTAFTTLLAGGMDILCGGATWSFTRDTVLGLDFSNVYYYGGQGFLVHRDLGVSRVADLDGATICVAQGTTNELNLADYFKTHGLGYRSVTFSEFERGIQAYQMRRCDAFTTNRAGLAAWAMGFRDPENHVVLAEQISREPQAAVIRQDDPRWRDLVIWIFNVPVLAEELGVNQANVDAMRKHSKDPEVQRLLGVIDDAGAKLGLANDWAYHVIREVGNYQDVWQRHFGPARMERGPNALWSSGGLIFALPMR